MIGQLRRGLLEHLFEAVQQNRLQAVQTLLDDYPMLVFRKDPLGDTALMWASAKGWMDMVTFLISRGAPIGVSNFNGDTAIHCAARQGHAEIAHFLLEKNPRIRFQPNSKNETPDFWLSPKAPKRTILPFKKA